MHIGVTVWSTAIAKPDEQEYVAALLNAMPAIAPQHHLTIIADEAFLPLSPNMKVLQLPIINSYFGLRRWYGKTLPTLLKKENIEALIVINGITTSASIRQLPVFLSPSSALNTCTTWLRFLYKSYTAKHLQKADSIGTVTSLQASEMKSLYGVKESQLFATGYAIPTAYPPMEDWQQRETFLQKQTGGKEYFLYIGGIDEELLLHLLKAFSLFKKWQQSNMQLLVPIEFSIGKMLQEKLDTYKYRQDVQLISNPDRSTLPQLLAGAYAVLFTKESTTTAFPVAMAMQCQVPVIGLENNEALKEVAGNAALYADEKVEGLAEQMKLIYKDEALRQSLIYNTWLQTLQLDGREAARRILTRLTVL